jgi:hypothetical protein
MTTVSTSSPTSIRVTVHAFRRGQRMASLSWYQFNPS